MPDGFILTNEIFRCHAAILACDELRHDVEQEIRDALYRKALEERYQDWLARELRESHDVEVLN